MGIEKAQENNTAPRQPTRSAGGPTEFERSAADVRGSGLLSELFLFFRHNKKWWMAPVVLILLALGALLILSSSAVAPFIYTLF
jgi:hypothetical protein